MRLAYQSGIMIGTLLSFIAEANPVWLFIIWPILTIFFGTWLLWLIVSVVRHKRRIKRLWQLSEKPRYVDIPSRYPYENKNNP